MKYTRLEIPDMVLMEPGVFGDERGFFMETFRENDFRREAADVGFVQENHSASVCGILRGLHYQIRQPQGKLVRVVSGSVFDVSVDLRQSSPFFGKWCGVNLSAENKRMVWIPPGFAHGFCVTSAKAEFVYKCTDYYAPAHERTIRWDDPEIGIQWPLPDGAVPVLSAKDRDGQLLRDAEVFA